MIETLFPYVYIVLGGFISFLSQFESLLRAKIDFLALSKVFLFLSHFAPCIGENETVDRYFYCSIYGLL